MKCPSCQAKLLPIQGDLFCLQCGRMVHHAETGPDGPVKLEDTTDPVLRAAVNDAIGNEMNFNNPMSETPPPAVPEMAAPAPAPEPAPVKVSAPVSVPVAAEVASPAPVPVATQAKTTTHTFASMRAILAPPVQATTSGSIAVAPRPAPAVVPAVIPSPPAQASSAPGFAPAQTGMLRAWMIGVVGLAVFVGLNWSISVLLTNKVYPGVKVGNKAVGGMTYAQLHEALPEIVGSPKLVAVVDSKRFDLSIDSGVSNLSSLEEQIKQLGRSTPLPIAGVVTSWFSPAIAPTFHISDDALDKTVRKLQAAVNREATNALPVTLGTNLLVLSEKSGWSIDAAKARAAIRAAYGHAQTADISPERLKPTVSAADYANDITAGQAIITTTTAVNLRQVTYTPSPEQIASWLVFGAPGAGVQVNPAGVAAFVASIPGKFDRAATYAGLISALNSRQATVLRPSIRKITGTPAAANLAPVLPLARFSYCVDDATGDTGLASELLKSGSGGAWTMGGRLMFGAKTMACNFAVHVVATGSMATYDPACAKQTTCRIHNELVISRAAWDQVPDKWAGDLSSYRSEMITHLIGIWLGFEHAACNAGEAAQPVLSKPSIIIPGCSPNWFAVAPESQDGKVLPGF